MTAYVVSDDGRRELHHFRGHYLTFLIGGRLKGLPENPMVTRLATSI